MYCVSIEEGIVNPGHWPQYMGAAKLSYISNNCLGNDIDCKLMIMIHNRLAGHVQISAFLL